jgi:elongation factor P hydroxylase
MDYAIAVPLKRIAIGVRRLGIAASTRILNANSVAGEHRRSLEQFRFWCIGDGWSMPFTCCGKLF